MNIQPNDLDYGEAETSHSDPLPAIKKTRLEKPIGSAQKKRKLLQLDDNISLLTQLKGQRIIEWPSLEVYTVGGFAALSETESVDVLQKSQEAEEVHVKPLTIQQTLGLDGYGTESEEEDEKVAMSLLV